MTADVMAAQAWQTNGHLIEGVAKLGFITADMDAADLTHGRGVWWQRWRPDRLTKVTGGHDPKAAPADLIADFRALPFPSGRFDLVAFDPPYMPMGTPAQFSSLFAHYGVGNTNRAVITELITQGLNETARVCRPGGTILTKAGRGIDGAKLWRGDDLMVDHGEGLRLEVIAQFLMLTRPRSQAHRGPQRNPRSNYSTLTVWRKP